jgi:Domain of unknown function (DUF4177)
VMQRFEYKVVPAPTRGEKVRSAKTSADRFAYALSQIMNALGREGWDYVRADTLPSEERSGFTGRTTVYHNMLVFRRALPDEAGAASPYPPLSADAPQGLPLRIAVAEAGSAPRLGPAIPAVPAAESGSEPTGPRSASFQAG